MATGKKVIITTADAPLPKGPYNQGVLVGNTLYLAGQGGLLPKTGELVSEDVCEQAEQCIKNLGAVLAAAGGSYQDMVKTTIFLTDIGDFSQVNKVYQKFFSSEPPVRSVVQVSGIPAGCKVKIEGIAHIVN